MLNEWCLYFSASASEDVTMATWGGSTAGNLESIEEDGSGEGQVIEEEDDGQCLLWDIVMY